ncbi:hypothetical protein DFH07DRAFT_766084 [Mycena maculata]|uniref:Uncharacterized protein n=1 Tax=Mycena maculata TaxID=230809 RepID=A0AAD7K5Z3_9AGAR|nr:hypothetical protein DFH07DRAFT_766084 [Mycena maculata]
MRTQATFLVANHFKAVIVVELAKCHLGRSHVVHGLLAQEKQQQPCSVTVDKAAAGSHVGHQIWVSLLCQRTTIPAFRRRARRTGEPQLRGHIELSEPVDLMRSRILGGWGTAGDPGTSAQLLSPLWRHEAMEFDLGESEVSSEGDDKIMLTRILVLSQHEQLGVLQRSMRVMSIFKMFENMIRSKHISVTFEMSEKSWAACNVTQPVPSHYKAPILKRIATHR